MLYFKKVYQPVLAMVACLLYFAQPANASSQCVNANPSSVDQVFECIATATLNKYNNANPFAKSAKMQCVQLRQFYSSVLMGHGVKANEVADKLPGCAVFAKALVELNGKPPLWVGCLNYKPGVEHMVTCLTSLLEQQPVNRRQPEVLNNCVQAKSFYKMMLMSLKETVDNKFVPDNYVEPDCDEYLTALKRKDSSVSDKPCANFEASNINSHAKTCLTSAQQLTTGSAPLNCQLMRQIYEGELKKVYGTTPDGYRLLPCSVLNPIIAEIENIRNAG